MSENLMQKDELAMSLGTIIDNDLDFLKEHISGKDLGYIISVKNLLAVAYDELAQRKDGVIAKRKDFEIRDEKESVEGCTILIQQIYSKLQSVEEKHTYLNEHITKVQKEVMQNMGN